jgi:hypothetical protein
MKPASASGPPDARRKGDTTARRDRDAEPQLPHERDESTSKDTRPRPRIEQAHRDVSKGLVDTDRGPVMDATYKRQK